MSTALGADDPDLTVDDMLLMATIARRHYVDDATRVEIAQELGISRFRVARLLEQAVRHGIVRIEIHLPQDVDAGISLRLRDHFGLARAVVVRPGEPSPDAVRDAIGSAGAHLLFDLVGPDDVVGVTAGRTVDSLVEHLRTLPACEVTQLTGMSGDLSLNSVEVARRIAGGVAHTIYAPLVLDSPDTAAALRADPAIAGTIAQFPRVSVAFVAVGSWSPPESRFYEALTPADRKRLLSEGVCADIAGTLVDAQGRAVRSLEDRTIGIDLEGLRAIPNVVAVAGGVRKVDALRAALLSGAVNGIVTDAAAAEALLADPAPS